MRWARVFAGDRLLTCYLEHVAAKLVVRCDLQLRTPWLAHITTITTMVTSPSPPVAAARTQMRSLDNPREDAVELQLPTLGTVASVSAKRE